MRYFHRSVFRQAVALLLIAGTLCWSTGCATLAHRSSYSYDGKESVTACEHKTEICPWLIGDALLLLPGIVPGVIAFAVDFGTGAWRHDGYGATASARTEPDPIMPAERRQRPREMLFIESPDDSWTGSTPATPAGP
jgi:hypothetical protein